MDDNLTIEWSKVEELVQNRFDEKLDIQTILFIIGLQELGITLNDLKKEEKLDVIHIGICSVLEPKGYYKTIGKDNDGWPHFKNIKKLPHDIQGESQNYFLKRAIIDYFGIN